MSINLPIVNRLIPGHAGRGGRIAAPQLLTMHVQEGNNDLPSFFQNQQADSTMWCMRDGTMVRMLNDEDVPWTNGDMVEPLNHANPKIQYLVNQGYKNSNFYCLTIEHQGIASQGFTDAQYESTAKMCAIWCLKYNLTPDRNTIIGHYEIGEHKACPGNKFDFNKLVNRTAQLVAAEKQPKVNSQMFDSIDVIQNTPRKFEVNGDILNYFNVNGGINEFGLPLSPEVDAKTFNLSYKGTAQYFQRARLEYHDDDGKIYRGLVGAELLVLIGKPIP